MHDDALQGLKSVLETAEPKMIEEIIREAETFLDSQLRAGLASDQRAITFASVIAAASAVLIGGVVTVVATNADNLSKVWPLIPVTLCFLVAIGAAFWVCRPTTFYYAGSNPVHWREDIEEKRELREASAGQAFLYAKGIKANDDLLAKNAGLMRIALIWAGFGIFLSAVAMVLVVSL